MLIERSVVHAQQKWPSAQEIIIFHFGVTEKLGEVPKKQDISAGKLGQGEKAGFPTRKL